MLLFTFIYFVRRENTKQKSHAFYCTTSPAFSLHLLTKEGREKIIPSWILSPSVVVSVGVHSEESPAGGWRKGLESPSGIVLSVLGSWRPNIDLPIGTVLRLTSLPFPSFIPRLSFVVLAFFSLLLRDLLLFIYFFLHSFLHYFVLSMFFVV